MYGYFDEHKNIKKKHRLLFFKFHFEFFSFQLSFNAYPVWFRTANIQGYVIIILLYDIYLLVFNNAIQVTYLRRVFFFLYPTNVYLARTIEIIGADMVRGTERAY